MQVGERIARNTAYLVAGDFTSRFVSSVATLLVARHLNAEGYGVLGTILAFSSISSLFSEFGSTDTFLRESARRRDDIARLLGGSLRLRLVLAGGTTVGAGLLVLFLYPDNAVRVAMYSMFLPMVWGGVLQWWSISYFLTIQEMQYVVVIRATTSSCTALLVGLGIALNWSVVPIAMAYGVPFLVGGVLGMTLISRRIEVVYTWDEKLLKGIGGFAIGAVLLYGVLPHVGPVVLERVTDLAEVGYFVAALRLPGVILRLPEMVATAFYPVLFQFHGADREAHLRLSAQQVKISSLFGMSMGLPLCLYAGLLTEFLFGASWVQGTSPALAILAAVVALQGVNLSLSDGLATQGLQSRRTAVMALATATGLTLYVVLGQRWGAVGGAGAALALEAVLFLGFVLANPRGRAVIRQGLPLECLILGALGGILLRLLVGPSWLGLLLTPVVAAVSALGDGEIRQIARLIMGRVFAFVRA